MANSGINDCFILQWRAIDAKEQVPIGALPATGTVALVEELVISHCPRCGASLHRFYRNRLDEFRRQDLKLSLDGET